MFELQELLRLSARHRQSWPTVQVLDVAIAEETLAGLYIVLLWYDGRLCSF
jgi:hypothetical protein